MEKQARSDDERSAHHRRRAKSAHLILGSVWCRRGLCRSNVNARKFGGRFFSVLNGRRRQYFDSCLACPQRMDPTVKSAEPRWSTRAGERHKTEAVVAKRIKALEIEQDELRSEEKRSENVGGAASDALVVVVRLLARAAAREAVSTSAAPKSTTTSVMKLEDKRQPAAARSPTMT
jgi:hypothetical protein